MAADAKRPELIEDHEVQSADQDRLGHEAVADQIVQLVNQVPTPTNIALYGAWGSGKTGIANLVDAGLRKDASVGKTRFVRFDAFKFAETPLRRNFINAVATELAVKKRKYHGDLYTGVTETKFQVPFVDVWAVLRIFIGVLVAVCAVLVGIAALVASIQSGNWHTNFTKNSRSFVVAGFPFAALLTAVFALAAKAFGREHRTERAESDEQFEELFQDLVADSNADKIVIFVDEVDRCSPAEVVSTLDAIRTFLGAKKCVFIVAADQQVLETALSKKVRQATPDDNLNPYYSSGSAYLDKIFQYQISVPPVPKQSITHYAVQLVENRLGIWDAPNRDTIVSILVPSHVRSPRRVKHLLNSYVVAHRVAERRKSAGLLDSWTEDRAVELAKLVCIQVEFPVFARAMVEVPLLPQYVRAAAGGGNWTQGFPYIKPREKELAEQYAHGLLPADLILAATVNDEPESDESTPVQQAYSTQLVDYLSRTAAVPGPARDLIFMQGLGASFGIPSEIADRVIEAAQNDRADTVKQEVDETNESAILDLVTEELRSAVGVERHNVASVVISLLQNSRVNLEPRADTIITNLSPAIAESPELINETSLAALWQITGLSSLPEADRIAKGIVSGETLKTNPRAAAALFRNVGRVVAEAPAAVDDLLSHFLTSDYAQTFVENLSELGSDEVARLVQAAPHLADEISDLWIDAETAQKRLDADRKVDAQYAPLPAHQQVNKPAATALEGDQETVDRGQAATTALNLWAEDLSQSEEKVGIQSLIRVALSTSRIEGRHVAANHLSDSGEWRDTSDNDLILAAMERRQISDLPQWLDSIDASRATPETVVEVLGGIVAKLLDPSTADDEVATIAPQLGRIIVVCSETLRGDLERHALATLTPAVSDDDEALQRISLLQRVAVLVGAEVVRPHTPYGMESTSLAEALRVEQESVEANDALALYVNESINQVLRSWGEPDPLPVDGMLYEALQACTWLPEPLASQLRLQLQRRAGREDGEPTFETVISLINDQPTSAARTARLWLEARTSDRFQLAGLALGLQKQNAWQDIDFCQALRASREQLSRPDQARLLETLLHDRFTIPSAVLAACGWSQVDDETALDLVIQRMQSAKNNPERKQVLDLAAQRIFTGRAVRSRYVADIVIPLFSQGVEATSNALDAVALFGKPFPGEMRKPVLEAIKPAIKDNERLTAKATEVLSKLNFVTRGKGPFGLGGRTLKLD